MVKKHIILCFSLIIILSAFIYFILFGFGIQCNRVSRYLPSKQGEAFWVTEDGDSWFRVTKEYEYLSVGELTINGKTTKCHYHFDGTDTVWVLLNYEYFFDETKADNDIIEYFGNCEFYKNKVKLKLRINEEQTVFMEFHRKTKKTGDGSVS